MFNQGVIAFGTGGIRSINGAPGPAITFAGVSGIFVERQGNTIFVGASGVDEVVYTSGHYSPTHNDDVILADAAAGPIVITLPDADNSDRNKWSIKKIDETANTVMLSGIASAQIDFNATVLLTSAGESLTVIAGQSQYWII